MAIDPRRIAESLVRENSELRARLGKAEETINQRAVDTVGETLDGLGYLIRTARTGDRAAMAVLQLLVNRFGEATVLARLQLPGSENGAVSREQGAPAEGDHAE